jgi:hypothetical protein
VIFVGTSRVTHHKKKLKKVEGLTKSVTLASRGDCYTFHKAHRHFTFCKASLEYTKKNGLDFYTHGKQLDHSKLKMQLLDGKMLLNSISTNTHKSISTNAQYVTLHWNSGMRFTSVKSIESTATLLGP